MLRKSKTPYVRDVFLAYLIDGARRTKTDEYPIIEDWMVATEPPKDIIQWNRRRDAKDPSSVGMSFYCDDIAFQPILGNPKAYVEKLKSYSTVIGLDASPYDNMPIWVQKSQIGLNLGITYYFGCKGIKIIPNVRLGSDATLSSLEAVPHNSLIAIGTNGFIRKLSNREIFKKQIKSVVDILNPTGICVYGPTPNEIFDYVKAKGIPIYQYDSYTMKENAKDKMVVNLSEVNSNERK